MQPAINKEEIIGKIDALLKCGDDFALQIIGEFEVTFVQPMADRLSNLTMREIIKRKNPYLYMASGISTCEEMTRRAFNEQMATIEGNYFGYFFEGIAKLMSGGIKPAGGGQIDLEIRKGNEAYVYAIKSGPGAFNSSSERAAIQDLESAERRLRQDRITTHKKIGFAYGRKRTSLKSGVEKLASKRFWEELSGDSMFYIKLLDISAALAPLYQSDLEDPYQRLLNEAYELFCDGDVIRWDKVIGLVSGR